jgi:hypothetical protein
VLTFKADSDDTVTLARLAPPKKEKLFPTGTIVGMNALLFIPKIRCKIFCFSIYLTNFNLICHVSG